jgi:copper chaperone CopZ
MTTDTITLTVPGMTCGHCEAAVKGELTKLANVSSVEVDLDTKLVTVTGTDLQMAPLAAAIDEAGFELAER